MTPEEKAAKKRDSARAWRAANREKIAAYKRADYHKNGEKSRAANRARYQKDPARRLAQERARWLANHDTEIAKASARRAADPEKFRQSGRKYRAEKPASYRLYGTRRSAKHLGVECDLDLEWFESRLAAGVCEMSGLPFDASKRGPNSPSVDRIDPKGPYTKANCRMILWWLNRAMTDLGEDYALHVFGAVMALRAQTARAA